MQKLRKLRAIYIEKWGTEKGSAPVLFSFFLDAWWPWMGLIAPRLLRATSVPTNGSGEQAPRWPLNEPTQGLHGSAALSITTCGTPEGLRLRTIPHH